MSPTPPNQDEFRKILIRNFIAPAVAVIVTAAVFCLIVFRLLSDSTWVDHTDQVVAKGNDALKLIVDSETGVRGYLITGREKFLDPFSHASVTLDAEIAALKRLTADNPGQLAHLEQIHDRYQKWLIYARAVTSMKRKDPRYHGYVAEEHGKAIMDEIRGQFDRFIDDEEKLRDERVRVASQTTRFALFFIIVTALITGAVVIFSGRRQLRALSDSYRRLTTELSARLNALRESERFKTTLLNITPIPLFFKGNDFRYTGCNKAYEILIGKTEREIAGKSSFDLHPPEIAKLFDRMDREIFATGRTQVFEGVIESPSKGHRQIVTHRELFRDAEGKNAGVVGAIIDMTDQKKLEESLRAAIDVRDEFLSIASHELKTPVTTIKLQTQLLRSYLKHYRENPEFLKPVRCADKIDDYTRRLTALIDGLLDVSRVSAGKLTLNLDNADLSALLEEVVDHSSPSLRDAGIEIERHIDGNVHARIDRLRIEQVIANLLSNAVKYAAGHPIEIRLRSQDDKVIFSVRDHGPGIPTDALEKIFDRFERIGTDSTRVSGLGLGLYISRQIVNAHHGKIWAEGAVGQGCCFTVEIPARS